MLQNAIRYRAQNKNGFPSRDETLIQHHHTTALHLFQFNIPSANSIADADTDVMETEICDDLFAEMPAKSEQDEDPFVAFVEYAKTLIFTDGNGDEQARSENEVQKNSPGWGWIASRILKTCIAYSSGVTEAILLSDLAQV